MATRDHKAGSTRLSAHSASPVFWQGVEREMAHHDPEELRCFEQAGELPIQLRVGFARELWTYLRRLLA